MKKEEKKIPKVHKKNFNKLLDYLKKVENKGNVTK